MFSQQQQNVNVLPIFIFRASYSITFYPWKEEVVTNTFSTLFNKMSKLLFRALDKKDIVFSVNTAVKHTRTFFCLKLMNDKNIN